MLGAKNVRASSLSLRKLWYTAPWKLLVPDRVLMMINPLPVRPNSAA